MPLAVQSTSGQPGCATVDERTTFEAKAPLCGPENNGHSRISYGSRRTSIALLTQGRSANVGGGFGTEAQKGISTQARMRNARKLLGRGRINPC